MNTLSDLADTSPEIVMNHYDRPGMDSEGKQQAALAAKEASYVQMVGYVPTSSISAQDWEDQVHRNKISKARGGEYRMSPDPARSGSMY